MQNNYYDKYIKYKKKYLISKQTGGIKITDSEFPTQDVYENSIEPVWKNIIANEINDFIDEHYKKLDRDSIDKLNKFIDSFNSLYELNSVLGALNTCIESISDERIKLILGDILYSVNTQTRDLMVEIESLNDTTGPNNVCQKCVTKTPYTSFDIGRIANKKIFILDQRVDEFSLGTNYFNSVGNLIAPSQYSDSIPIDVKIENFYRGFRLEDDEKRIIVNNIQVGVQVNNSMLQILLNLDRHIEYGKDLTFYEINKNDSGATIQHKISDATLISYFYIGKLYGVISNQLHYKQLGTFYSGELYESDPIKSFLLTAGVLHSENELNDKISAGFQQMALSHIAHGMSSAELVARIASSVRTSYPQALISALCVRSGAYHGGAMQRAIPMIKSYFDQAQKIISSNGLTLETIESDVTLNNWITGHINKLLADGKIYGFGHRIHKSPESGKSCADPRALEYLEIVHRIYDGEYPVLLKLVDKFLNTVRIAKSSLGCNSDFAIAVFCVLTDIPDSEAEGMFVMCRIPGFCARIVRELLGKPNARRLPFAPILPYIPPKI